jgi:tetratricopeptide (TPR) repeat protein
MKAYYETEQYDKAVGYANKVLGDSSTDANVRSDAQLIIARSSLKRNDMAAAKRGYAEVLNNSNGAIAAEATFYKAYFENQEGKHDQAIATVKVSKTMEAIYGRKRSGGYGKSYDAEANIERSNCTRCDRQFLTISSGRTGQNRTRSH